LFDFKAAIKALDDWCDMIEGFKEEQRFDDDSDIGIVLDDAWEHIYQATESLTTAKALFAIWKEEEQSGIS